MSENTTPALDNVTACAVAPDDCGPLCRRMVLAALRDMKLGHLSIELPEGGLVEFGTRADARVRRMPDGLSASAHIRVLSPGFFSKCVLSGDIGFAESYLDGDWTTPDLSSVIGWFILNIEHAPTLSGSRIQYHVEVVPGCTLTVERLREERAAATTEAVLGWDLADSQILES